MNYINDLFWKKDWELIIWLFDTFREHKIVLWLAYVEDKTLYELFDKCFGEMA